jgi:hypothetical protein
MKKILIPGIVAGIAMLVVGLVLSYLFGAVFPQVTTEYQTPGLFRPWTDPWMSYIYVHPFIMGVLLAWLWQMTKGMVKDSSPIKKGYKWGCYLWVVFGIPGMLMTLSSFPVSYLMVASWSISALVQYKLAGIVFAKMSP